MLPHIMAWDAPKVENCHNNKVGKRKFLTIFLVKCGNRDSDTRQSISKFIASKYQARHKKMTACYTNPTCSLFPKHQQTVLSQP